MVRCCNTSCLTWIVLQDSLVLLVRTSVTWRAGYVLFLLHLIAAVLYFSSCWFSLYGLHIIKVKIKRKQRLVKKEIQPIFTQDAMMDGPQTEGVFSVLHFDFYLLFSGFNLFGFCGYHLSMLKFLCFLFDTRFLDILTILIHSWSLMLLFEFRCPILLLVVHIGWWRVGIPKLPVISFTLAVRK